MTAPGPRPRPCASCPYRRDVPSGVWMAEEYERLRAYDGDIPAQLAARATAVFACHQGDGLLCSGWLGHREHPTDLLAVRLNASHLHSDTFDYATDVPLFASGAEAADHGVRDVQSPSQKAQQVIAKVTRVRACSSAGGVA